VVWGVATLPLSEVVASPSTWGERQQLELKGHRLAGKGATLEVQLFLSTVRLYVEFETIAAFDAVTRQSLASVPVNGEAYL
jgi:hypothetical protein